MGPLKYNARARGRMAMEETLTVTDKVYRAFRSGRPFKKSRLMLPPDALAEVCEMRDKLRKAMQDANLSAEDSAAAIVFQVALDEPPVIKVVRVGRETDVLDLMHGKYAAVTVGALFALRDRERGVIRRWAHPFLLTDAAGKTLEAALDEMEKKRAWMN